MKTSEEIINEMYQTLVELQCPLIAQTDLKDFESIVLNGENCITLLSWLLTRSCPDISAALENHKDSTIHKTVKKYYTQLGIYMDIDSLLSNSATKDQDSVLQTLLIFMKESLSLNGQKARVDESEISTILQKHVNENIDLIPSSCGISLRLSYTEGKKYFDGIKQKVLLEDSKYDNNINSEQCVSPCQETIKSDHGSLVPIEEQFISAFDSISSWSIPQNKNFVKSITGNKNMQNISSTFSFLKQTLNLNKEVSKLTVPAEIKKLQTPLDEVIEDNLICLEKVNSLYNN
ncbi:uncharacterized protein LOC105703347 isoform X2 [Orussus abietinus]|uniref:uncharacterized protein LOC105703347 isoform X2 n=1 Tax=Orussus abietinus TaxID=222816 RepID=UPI00062594C5|nr:uncharacterized protein LOC105703347 isoform X2 [Orussus abietinus]